MLRVRPYCGLGQAAPDNGVPFSVQLQQEVRNIPACFTAKQAAEILERVAEVLRKAQQWQPSQAATDAAQVWRGKIPWFFQSDKTYCRTSQEYKDLVFAITGAYADASAVVGQQKVEEQAREEFVQAITHPTLPPVPTPFGEIPWTPILVGAGVLWFLGRPR